MSKVFSYISYTDLENNIIEGLNIKYDFITIDENEMKRFFDYITNVNSSILGQYKFLYIYESKISNIPNLTNCSVAQWKKIPTEISDWVLVDKSVHKDSGVKVSKVYSFFLKQGTYQIDDRFVIVSKL